MGKYTKKRMDQCQTCGKIISADHGCAFYCSHVCCEKAQELEYQSLGVYADYQCPCY